MTPWNGSDSGEAALSREGVKEPNADEPAGRLAELEPLRHVLVLARPHLPRIVAVLLLMLVGSGISAVVPSVAGSVVDSALSPGKALDLDRMVLVLLALFAVMAAVHYVSMFWLASVGARFLNELRSKLFAKLVSLSPAFHGTHPVGELNARLLSNLSVVQQAITVQLPSGCIGVVRALTTSAVLLYMHAQLTLVALVAVPVIAVVCTLFGKRLESAAMREQDALARSGALAEEVLAGIQTVQTFGTETRETRRYEDALGRLLGVEIEKARLEAAFGALLLFFGFGAIAAVLWHGGRLMSEGQLSAGDLTSFMLYCLMLATAAAEVGIFFSNMKELKGASRRVAELLEQQPTVEDKGSLELSRASAPHIRLERVDFSYPSALGRPAVLSQVSMEILPGERVAVVGPNGAGKSTLMNLLLRFYDVDAGRIDVAGRPLAAYRLASLRRSFGVVSQHVLLFSGSILDNVRYGHEGASEEDAWAALDAVGAGTFVRSLPRGLHEPVGQGGLQLSGGQRQRIALARALLGRPQVLLFDEATSALDPESEEAVSAGLRLAGERRTHIVITHRLSTARHCDRVVFMESGRVVDQGPHDVLNARCEPYRRYWSRQLGEPG